MSSIIDKARNFLFGRAQAYQQTFNPESVFVRQVLEDLETFCRGDKSTFHADPRIHAALEGRREVWLRILDHTKLNMEDLWKKYGRGKE